MNTINTFLEDDKGVSGLTKVRRESHRPGLNQKGMAAQRLVK